MPRLNASQREMTAARGARVLPGGWLEVVTAERAICVPVANLTELKWYKDGYGDTPGTITMGLGLDRHGDAIENEVEGGFDVYMLIRRALAGDVAESTNV